MEATKITTIEATKITTVEASKITSIKIRKVTIYIRVELCKIAVSAM